MSITFQHFSNDNSITRHPSDPRIPNNFNFNEEKEWIYKKRRCMQEIIPNVFLGPYSAASCSQLQSLLDHGITHIICIRHTIEANIIKPNFPDRFKYLVLNIADTKVENIIQHFQKVKAFIDESLNSCGRVLIHGNAGISRSAALVLAYIMETYKLSQEEAYSIVQQRRFCINPNEGFLRQLKEYEFIYQARKTSTYCQHISNPRKRTIYQTNIEIDNLEEDEFKSKKTIDNTWGQGLNPN